VVFWVIGRDGAEGDAGQHDGTGQQGAENGTTHGEGSSRGGARPTPPPWRPRTGRAIVHPARTGSTGWAGEAFCGKNAPDFVCQGGGGLVILSLHFRLLFSPAGGRHMLTDYMVTCPHVGCHWSGSLLPSRNREAWLSA